MILIVVFLSSTIITFLFYRWGFVNGFNMAKEEMLKIINKEIDEHNK